MNRFRLLQLSLAAGALATLGGCMSAGTGPKFDPRKDAGGPGREFSLTNTLDPALLRPAATDFRLGPGDRVDIELIGQNEPVTSALVGPDGKIYFGLLPGLNVWGLTPREVRDLVEREVAKYVNHPRVSVTLREVQSRRVWILGRVNTPGLYSLNSPTTLIEGISRAGGLMTSAFTGTTEELADLRHSFVMRGGKYLPVNFERLVRDGDMSQNIDLRPDDFVFLPSASAMEIYVIGAVTQPRAVAFKDQVTLSSAIATAGGLLPTAHPREIVVVRGSLTEPRCAVVNLLAIAKGKSPEIPLQPRDIVYVPDTPLDGLQKAGYLVIQTFVRTVAANEGLRAGGTVQQVGVNLNVNP
jgi:protein involved in polysaccharide export with SLBB domain